MTKEEWENWKSENQGDIWALKDLAEDNGCEDIFERIIFADDMDETVINAIYDGRNWKDIYYMLSNIVKDSDSEYFELNGDYDFEVGRSWDEIADEVESRLNFED